MKLVTLATFALVAAAVALAGEGGALAQTGGQTAAGAPTPTPTPTSTPTATPEPTPVPGSSTITVRFVRDGEPVTFTGNREAIVADGVGCQFPEPAAPYAFPSQIKVPWPMGGAEQGLFGQPSECTKGPPTTIHFEFSSEFGLLAGGVLWTGEDVTLDIEVPPGTPSPTPTSTPTPPAGELPETGAALDDRSSWDTASLLLVGGLALAAASAALYLYRRS